MFKTYKATINHAGKIFHQIEKDDLSAAEVLVLKAVHGPQGVMNIIETKGEKQFAYTDATEDGAFKTLSRLSTMPDEKAYLEEKYGIKKFSEVFPGFAPALPTNLDQVGVQYTALPASTVESFKTEVPKEEPKESEGDVSDVAASRVLQESRLPKHLRG